MRKVNPFKPTAGAEPQSRQVVTRLSMTLRLGSRRALARPEDSCALEVTVDRAAR